MVSFFLFFLCVFGGGGGSGVEMGVTVTKEPEGRPRDSCPGGAGTEGQSVDGQTILFTAVLTKRHDAVAVPLRIPDC